MQKTYLSVTKSKLNWFYEVWKNMDKKELEQLINDEFGDTIDFVVTLNQTVLRRLQDDDLIDTYLATAYKVYKKGLNYFQPEEATRFTMMYLRNSYKIQDIDKD